MSGISAEWAFALVLAGIALNACGLALGARALVVAHREYGSGPLLPWVARALRFAKSLPARLPWVHREPISIQAAAAMHCSVTGSARLVSRATFPEGLSDEERLTRLQQAVLSIYSEIETDRRLAGEEHRKLVGRVGELESDLSAATNRLETLTRQVASQDVRTQLLGLLCVALGTVLLATPSVWDLATKL